MKDVAVSQGCDADGCDGLGRVDTRAVFLTHYIPLYQVRVLQEVSRRVAEFKILLSTPIEPNRDFQPDWTGLDVRVQKNVIVRRRWRHRGAGFDDSLYVHIPYDTLRRLRAISPHVVVSHELGVRSIAAARYCRRSGAKLVLVTFMSEHTEQGRGWLRRRIRRRLIETADAITYNGPSCREYLRSLGASDEKLFHFPYAADDRNIPASLPIRNEDAIRRRLLCIGQLSERKGVLPMIRQLSEFCKAQDETIELTLVGDGPQRREIEKLATRRSSSEQKTPHPRLRIHVLGNRPASELPSLMQSHGAVISPTLADEWLMVVNEAMHAGTPIIGSIYAQAVSTLIRDGQNGWRYDPLHQRNHLTHREGDNANFAGTLHSTLRRYLDASASEIARIREVAFEDISHYTPRRSADGLIAAITSVVPQNRH